MFTFNTSVGLYVGPNTVQLAQLRNIAGRIHLTNFVHVDIFEDEQRGAATGQEDLIVAAIHKAVHKSKIDLRRTNSILMPGMVLLRYFQMPRISEEEMEEAVRFEARKYIPFRLEEAVSGFYILKDDQESKKIGILSLVTKEESIKNHLALLKKVDVTPSAIETASFAILRLLEHSQAIDKQKSNVVIYLYAQRLNIIILKSGVPYFVRDISLAKKEEWIDDETAALLMAKGLSMTDSRVMILENFFSELRISFEYYKKELGKEDISKVILCGETDIFDDLDVVEEAAKDVPDASCPLAVLLQKKLEVPVELVDPLKNIQSPKAKPLPYTFAMLAVTIGAALRGLTKSTVEIDLFRARKKPSIKRKLFLNKLILIESGVLMGCFLLVFLICSIFVSREKTLLEKEKRQRPKFVDLTHFNDTLLSNGAREIKERLEVYNKFVKNRIFLTQKLNVIPYTVPEGIWLKEIKYKNILSAGKRRLEVELNGVVFSEQMGLEIEMVNEFAEKLKKDENFFGGFKTITTGSVTRAKHEGIPVMFFKLQCTSLATAR